MSDKVGSVGEGAPLPAREPHRRLPHPINGTEQYLAALLDTLDEVLHELRTARLDRARLDEVKEGDPVLELTEPAPDGGPPGPTFGTSIEVTEPADEKLAPLEIAEPAPGPKPAEKPTKKAAAKRPGKKAAPRR